MRKFAYFYIITHPHPFVYDRSDFNEYQHHAEPKVRNMLLICPLTIIFNLLEATVHSLIFRSCNKSCAPSTLRTDPRDEASLGSASLAVPGETRTFLFQFPTPSGASDSIAKGQLFLAPPELTEPRRGFRAP